MGTQRAAGSVVKTDEKRVARKVVTMETRTAVKLEKKWVV